MHLSNICRNFARTIPSVMSRRKSFTIWRSWSTSNCAKVLRRPSALTVQNTGQKASSIALVGLVRYLQSTRNDLTKGKFDTLSIPYFFCLRDRGMVRAIGRLMRSAEIASASLMVRRSLQTMEGPHHTVHRQLHQGSNLLRSRHGNPIQIQLHHRGLGLSASMCQGHATNQ